MPKTKQKFDLHQVVTDKIVAAIENGASGKDFTLPWVGRHDGAPTNATTKRPYRGVNILMLWMAATARGYKSDQWASYKQWEAKGATVRKGEKGEMIVFYREYPRKDTVTDASNGEETTTSRMSRVLRYSTVFNVSQVDGYDPAENPVVAMPDLAQRLTHCERYVDGTAADIRWREACAGGQRAYYNVNGDFIGMPAREAFKGSDARDATEALYGTLFHELTHWTGHESRCDRQFGVRFGSQAYAAEELVAELGASFLCAEQGIEHEPRADHAQYIDSWLTVLKGDKKAIFTAGAKASQAVDFLNGLQSDDRPPPPKPKRPKRIKPFDPIRPGPIPETPAPAAAAASVQDPGPSVPAGSKVRLRHRSGQVVAIVLKKPSCHGEVEQWAEGADFQVLTIDHPEPAAPTSPRKMSGHEIARILPNPAQGVPSDTRPPARKATKPKATAGRTYAHQAAADAPVVYMSDKPMRVNGVKITPRWAWSDQYRHDVRCREKALAAPMSSRIRLTA